MADAPVIVVVLANLMAADGTPNAETRDRVRLGCDIARARSAAAILFVGWAYRPDSDLPIAVAMARHAVAAGGCAPEMVLTETTSRDTAGDAILSRVRLHARFPDCRLIVATSDYHAARTRTLFRAVWGAEQPLEVVGAPTPAPADPEARAASEARSVAAFRRTFEGVVPEDLAGFIDRLAAAHPFYDGTAFPEHPFSSARTARRLEPAAPGRYPAARRCPGDAPMPEPFAIAGRPIGPDHPPFVICELSGNHRGELARALELVDAAAATGADAVKLQTYTADTITLDVDRPEFRIEGGPWDGRSMHDLYREASTPWEWHEALFERARKHGLTCFSSPFDPTAVDFLERLGAPAYKIASFELVDTPLIAHAASKGRPLIMSTGIADYAEIERACAAARSGGADGIALLHCISAYPAAPEEMRLGTIEALASAFGLPVGLSDHTLGSAVAVAAIARGACIVEKHMTLRRADGGPDAAFSLEPGEFSALVADCRMAHAALGPPQFDRRGVGGANAQFRRSLYVVRDVAAGAALTPEDVRSVRPGIGLAPRHLPDVMGRIAARALTRGEPLDWSMMEPV